MPGGPYRIAALGNAMGIGLEDSYSITLEAVAKRRTDDQPHYVANELICSEIAHFLRLPVPPCGIIHAPDVEPPFWFASLNFNLTGDALPPINPADCVGRFPDLATGIITFDLLVGNPDRNSGNLSMDTEAKPPRLNCYDHGVALFGSVGGEGEKNLVSRRDEFIITRHCLLKLLPTDRYFSKWIQRVRGLPDYVIEEICHEAIGLGVNKEEAEAAVDFLKHRRENTVRLITDNQARFEAIKRWGLLL